MWNQFYFSLNTNSWIHWNQWMTHFLNFLSYYLCYINIDNTIEFIKWKELFHDFWVIIQLEDIEEKINWRKNVKRMEFVISMNHFKVNKSQIKKQQILMISCDCVWILTQKKFFALNESQINRMKTITTKKKFNEFEIKVIRNNWKWWATVKTYPLKINTV